MLENTAGQGSCLGSSFEELRRIIDGVEDKSRIGVCLDTCHAFSAGYDLSTAGACNAVLCEFESIVGLHYLKACSRCCFATILGAAYFDRGTMYVAGHPYK